ncbi:MAG: hypothetical protein LBP59_06480 [Planctomycetaceae bacterium]|nr:hypothetical protein [Planctomycetaceae bacterium]
MLLLQKIASLNYDVQVICFQQVKIYLIKFFIFGIAIVIVIFVVIVIKL